MDQSIKDQWVRALRSGDYLQGKGQLGHARLEGNEYCCLGVLCEISPVESVNEAPCDCGQCGHVGSDISWDMSLNYLPTKVAEWANLTNDEKLNGDFIIALTEEDAVQLTDELSSNDFLSLGNKTSLSKLNDAGLPFSRIADLIERYVQES